MEKISQQEKEKEKIKRMLIEVMATHENLAKNLFEFNLKKKTIVPF